MLRFDSDYMEGCCPEILERLQNINFDKNSGYGADEYCRSAADKIRAACKCENAAVRFTVGGTQTNKLAIDMFLRPWQGVITAETGHIAVHESGAIESSGHKVLTIPGVDGRLRAEDVRAYMIRHFADESYEHTVQPGMVYISHPSEYGTLYSLAELRDLRAVCDEYGLKLFLDGARLGYGLAAKGTDVTLPDIAACCDVFYIGGTKVGCLFGEALVVPNPADAPAFVTIIKQHGALLAKGWLLGLQFDTLFTDGLYGRISAHAIELAGYLREKLLEKGVRLHIDSPTNQIFPVLENGVMQRLREKVSFNIWEPADENHTVIRFAISWCTKREDVDALLALL